MSQVERTLAIIKPDSVARGIAGEILSAIERAGFRIRAMRMLQLDRRGAEGFYAVHRGEPFFEGLIAFMTEGPAIVLALERENAILQWRELAGATDPAKAVPGTIRHRFGQSMQRNCVHGSDAPETACIELGYFFRQVELV
jgi:nucleoside-diphosphate kinase